jgi:hypothetical protein
MTLGTTSFPFKRYFPKRLQALEGLNAALVVMEMAIKVVRFGRLGRNNNYRHTPDNGHQ